jgi:hypothetical protein
MFLVTSLGYREDFDNPQFVLLMHNAARWTTGMPIDKERGRRAQGTAQERGGRGGTRLRDCEERGHARDEVISLRGLISASGPIELVFGNFEEIQILLSLGNQAIAGRLDEE